MSSLVMGDRRLCSRKPTDERSTAYLLLAPLVGGILSGALNQPISAVAIHQETRQAELFGAYRPSTTPVADYPDEKAPVSSPRAAMSNQARSRARKMR